MHASVHEELLLQAAGKRFWRKAVDRVDHYDSDDDYDN